MDASTLFDCDFPYVEEIKSPPLVAPHCGCCAGFGWLAYSKWFAPAATPHLITATVTKADIEDTVLATGAIQASKLTNVGSQVSGQLKKLHVQVGDVVKKGQLVAEIDSTTQTNALRAAEETVASYKAQKAAKQSALILAQQNYERQKYMFERDAASKADFQSATQSLAAAKADIKAMDAQIAQYQVQVSTARANLGYTRIVAPSDGTVVSVVTKEGQTVSASQSAPTIIKLADLSTMRIEAQISEADVPNVKPGMPAYFTILGNPDRQYDTTLVSVDPGPINMNTYDGTNTDSSSSAAVYYNGIFVVPNPDNTLRIQMTAQVTIVVQQEKGVLTIPVGALGKRAKDGSYTVRVVTGEPGKEVITEKPIKVGMNNRVQVAVTEGLKEGEKVVIGDSSGNKASGRTAMGPRMF